MFEQKTKRLSCDLRGGGTFDEGPGQNRWSVDSRRRTRYIDRGNAEFVDRPRTAPYVDFYSYHAYLSGPNEIPQGMTWDGAGGTPSLLSLILSSSTGEQAQYLKVLAAVQLGGGNSARNDDANLSRRIQRQLVIQPGLLPQICSTYSLPFNSSAVAQILNSTYAGANQVPGKMLYYSAASNPSSFCLRGIADAAMDCAPSNSSASASPYPQWYTYQLIASPGYLDLTDGGFMAKSVTLSAAAKAQGLIATGFYTATTNSILIINPTASSFAGVTVQISNSGLTRPQSTLFTLNSTNLKVSSWPASMIAATNGSQMTRRHSPPNSVLGISLRPNWRNADPTSLHAVRRAEPCPPALQPAHSKRKIPAQFCRQFASFNAIINSSRGKARTADQQNDGAPPSLPNLQFSTKHLQENRRSNSDRFSPRQMD